MVTFWAQWAHLSDGVRSSVIIEVNEGRIVAVEPDSPPGDATRLYGVTVPGFANAHSHAFHRALRGRTHHERGTFWSWRQEMYAMADRLDPELYYRLARAVYAEMAVTGVACVGEFHYLHHAQGGKRYSNPNAMGEALMAAAADAGIRLTLLDTLYVTGGFSQALTESQLRFSDGDVEHWAQRVDDLVPSDHVKVGAAAHSVRAVPYDQLSRFASATTDVPVHVHLSEQIGENEACVAEHGVTPAQLLRRHGLLRANLTAVHATHLTERDIELLGTSGSGVCFCPTTERDLADGIGPASALVQAGSSLSLGSDSHAVVDLIEEARALEMHERLATHERGHFATDELLYAATKAGHDALGWSDAGHIAVGLRADLVTIDLTTLRTAGAAPDGVLLAGNAADINHVIIDGRLVAKDGVHVDIDTAHELAEVIGELTT